MDAVWVLGSSSIMAEGGAGAGAIHGADACISIPFADLRLCYLSVSILIYQTDLPYVFGYAIM
ncbi:hypothetical protein CO666_13460 [Rhizobium chutanense]|uniref:Uncharacterized protein n=1 Tax=Rhizobium chutanense TaxID=2035448 RepID=A0A2A6JBI0_9HYPH|nr:hypothetical protein CO666_13460 [Rhizobium chutanense]